MPKAGAGVKAMYEQWRDASPAKPFPFQHGDIKYTWADVRSRMQKDITSTAMTFSTGHITPGVTQSLVMQDMYKKEHRIAAHHQTVQNSPSRRAQTAPEPSPGPPPSRPRLTEEEVALLYKSEGGGRGRTEFLKKRRELSPIHRYRLPLLSSHSFGWEIDRVVRIQEEVKRLQAVDPSEAQKLALELSKSQPRQSTEDHRRRAGMNSLLRTCGVFHGKAEAGECQPFPPYK
eukprot:PhM_4_TR10169/c0_g1_i1/m.55531